MSTSRTPHFRAVAVAAHAAAIVAACDRDGRRDLDPHTFPLAADEARHAALVDYQRSSGVSPHRSATENAAIRERCAVEVRQVGQRAAALILAQRRAATCRAPVARVEQVIRTDLGPQVAITGAPRALPLAELELAALQDDPHLGGCYAHLLIQAHALLG